MSEPSTRATCAALSQALRDHPTLARAPLTLLGSGTDHLAFAVGDHIIRVPRTPDAAHRGLAERRLTAQLAARLPLPVPVVDLVGAAAPGLPHGFAGHPRVPGSPALGRPLPPARRRPLAAALGGFLRRLHATPRALARAAGVPPDDDPGRDEWAAQALADLRSARDDRHISAAAARAIERLLERRPVAPGRRCLVHGDFAAEHVLLAADGAASGVIDWSDAMLGDPALDLAGLVHWGGPAMLAEALPAYGPCPAATRARARWFATCRALADLTFGRETARPEYLRAGLDALAHAGFAAIP